MTKEEFIEKAVTEITQAVEGPPKHCITSKYPMTSYDDIILHKCGCGSDLFYNIQGRIVCAKCFSTLFYTENYWVRGDYRLKLGPDQTFRMVDPKVFPPQCNVRKDI